MSRGGEWFECDGRTWWWERCQIPGCPNFICVGKSDRFCWPHSGSGESLETMLKRHRRQKVPVPA
jgi:hypothetical protein